MNLFKYKLTQYKITGEIDQILSEVFNTWEIENGNAKRWLDDKNYVSILDNLERVPFICLDKNGDELFAGDEVEFIDPVESHIWKSEIEWDRGGFVVTAGDYRPNINECADITLIKDNVEG